MDQQQRAQAPFEQQRAGGAGRGQQFVRGYLKTQSRQFQQQRGATLARGVGDETQRQAAGAQPGQGILRAG